MWPEHWMRKRIRRRAAAPQPRVMDDKEDENPDIFKRKNLEPKVDKEDLQWKVDTSPRLEL